MEITPVWIVTLSVLLVSALAVILIANFATKPIDSMGFSFKRIFPFEVIKNSGKVDYVYKIFLLIFVIACFSPLFNMLVKQGEISNLTLLSVLICCSYGLAAICFMFLHYFDATHTMAHLIIFVLFLCLTMLGNALAAIKGVLIFNVYSNRDILVVPTLVGAIICGLCSLVTVILALNPKLKDWAMLNKIDGGYQRPKIFILAYYEWLSFFLLLVGEASYFLVLLVQ